MTYVTHQPGDMTQGPRIEVGVATGWEWEPIDFDDQGLDELDDLIEELQQARAWLLEQDPNQRLHGPPAPPDPLLRGILAAYRDEIEHALKPIDWPAVHAAPKTRSNNGPLAFTMRYPADTPEADQ